MSSLKIIYLFNVPQVKYKVLSKSVIINFIIIKVQLMSKKEIYYSALIKES